MRHGRGCCLGCRVQRARSASSARVSVSPKLKPCCRLLESCAPSMCAVQAQVHLHIRSGSTEHTSAEKKAPSACFRSRSR